MIVLTEELARAGSGGVIASLLSHGIASPPIAHAGNAEQQQRFVAPVLAGEKIAALAITEPGGGSDVANLKTRAVRDGDHYIVDGSKTFITRSEAHTSELQSPLRISYAVFCLKKKKNNTI